MIVVDTNIISYLYITGDRSIQAERLFALDPHWTVPILWRSEFRSALSQYLRKQYLALEGVLLIIQQAEKILKYNEYEVSSTHIMQLVQSSKCSAYDCEFVALAQSLDVPLITADKNILKEFPDTAVSPDSYIN
ncbi:DNA-binding protein (plasmid) [Candidatus Tenderia electrophaga]|jgi:predicted nucleic acid-binding protein|uniref:DNA-binding protein n=1 Tax=Candidatus Tenderia electrophaga TaxID=1748243 RepID=A0A0S2TIJ6_9GAMM|nr:DNA-binding protein [Candidatus Tenderia electrophaga]